MAGIDERSSNSDPADGSRHHRQGLCIGADQIGKVHGMAGFPQQQGARKWRTPDLDVQQGTNGIEIKCLVPVPARPWIALGVRIDPGRDRLVAGCGSLPSCLAVGGKSEGMIL